MERKLDPSVRIQKVWKEWGDQKNEVALILRHYHSSTNGSTNTSTNDGYIDKRSNSNRMVRRKSTTSNHNHHHNKTTSALTTTTANIGSNGNRVSLMIIDNVKKLNATNYKFPAEIFQNLLRP